MSEHLTIRYTRDYPAQPEVPAGHTATGFPVEAQAGDVVTLSASVARARVAAGFAEFVS